MTVGNTSQKPRNKGQYGSIRVLALRDDSRLRSLVGRVVVDDLEGRLRRTQFQNGAANELFVPFGQSG